MSRRVSIPVILAALLAATSASVLFAQQRAAKNQTPAKSSPDAATAYFPSRFDWQHKKPEEVGMDSALLDEAVKQAVASENPATHNMMEFLATTFGAHEPLDTPIGPIKDRGPASGLITRHGYIVAEWGEPQRVDMTFSVTKTFLTTVVGLAWQRGLIRDVQDYARDYMPRQRGPLRGASQPKN